MEELLMNRFVEIFGEKGTACYFAPGRPKNSNVF